jgi:hypothetical protein
LNLNEFNENDGQQRKLDFGGGFQRAQSFLIPMAVVQASQSSNELGQPQGDPFSYELLGKHQQSMLLAALGGNEANGGALGPAGSQLHPQHAQPNANYQSASSTSGGQRVRSPSMNLHEFNRQQQQQQHGPTTSGAPISHGFMSSFLLGEKEKMTAAAMRLQKQRQLASSAGLGSSSTAPLPANVSQQHPATAGATAASQASHLQVAAPSNNDQPTSSSPPPSSTTLTTSYPKGPGGLMPSMIAPLSRMPDNAIGQAYGAAVGIALPAESGRCPEEARPPLGGATFHMECAAAPVAAFQCRRHSYRSFVPFDSSPSRRS